MNKKKNSINNFCYFILIIFVILFISNESKKTKYSEKIENLQNKVIKQELLIHQLENKIQLKDSLFKEHLSNCAMVSRDALRTNKFGDVFVMNASELTKTYLMSK